MDLKRFDETDWDAYAGCEPFADGSEPLIGEFTDSEKMPGNHGEDTGEMTEVSVIVVFDSKGSEALVYEYGDTLRLDDDSMSPEKAQVLARGIRHIADLHALGYELV